MYAVVWRWEWQGCGWGGPALPGCLELPLTLTPLWALASLAVSLGCSQLHQLEQMLLNTSFPGYNLTLQTPAIQSLAFKLSCNFSGLSLSSATLKRVPQVRGCRWWWWGRGQLPLP